MAFVEFQHVDKFYQMGEVRIEALRDVSFSIENLYLNVCLVSIHRRTCRR